MTGVGLWLKIVIFLAEIEKDHVEYLITVNRKICRGRNSQFVVSCQVVTTPCCGFGGYLVRFHLASDWS